MSRAHLTFEGDWANCPDVNCTLPFHVPDVNAEQAAQIPLELLLPIFEVVDPPTDRDEDGWKFWFQDGNTHRDYGLPAVIGTDGFMSWDQQSVPHRTGGRPAIIREDGSLEYWLHGRRVTQDGQPL